MKSSNASDGLFTAEADALAKLNELSSRLWTMQSLREGLEEMLAATIGRLGAHMGNVQILDAGRGVLTIAAQRGFEQDFLDFFREVSTEDDSACGRALRSGERIVIEDVETDAAYTPMRPLARAAGYRAVQSTPLIGRNGVRLGVLSTHFETPHRPTELELRGLDLYARQAADFIERCQTDQALRDSEARLKAELDDSELLRKVSVEMTNRGDAALLYERILDAAVTIMRSDYASVQMLYPDRGPAGELRLLGSRGFSPEAAAFWEWVRADAGSTCGMALRIGRRVIVPDVETCTEMAGTDDRATYLQAGIRAVQSTPLMSRSGVLVGMLSTHWNKPHEPTERELRLFDILARQATHLIEQTNAVEALRASKEQLLEADRRKDEFLAMLAHELRNPLAPIRTGLELIRLAGNTAASVERVRTTMERQVGHMVRLIDDLLDVSRITSGKIQLQRRPTPLADLVSNAVEANRAAIDAARIHLGVDLPEQPCFLDVDPTRMSQVLSNLLNNAVKFTQPGGHIDVSAQFTMPATNDTAGEVGLTVADDGIGISEEMLQRVFDLFTQGPQAKGGRTQPGLGIGLALARRLVEMHGGRIEATSQGLDQGSTFSVHLPGTPGLAAADSPQSDVRGETVTRRVVVIDDNEDAARTVAMLIEELGSETRVAHGGEAGLKVISEFRPDVVLLDIGMPGIDGYETCRRIRVEPFGPDLLIVALTGWGQERDKRRAIDSGFDAHLTKPADPAVLERILVASRRVGPYPGTIEEDPVGE